MWSVLTRLLEVQVRRGREYSAQFTEVGVNACLCKKRINGIRIVCMTENHWNPGTHGFLDLDRGAGWLLAIGAGCASVSIVAGAVFPASSAWLCWDFSANELELTGTH